MPPGRIQAWWLLTSKWDLRLPDCWFHLLWDQDRDWKWLCYSFHPEGKGARKMRTLLPAPTPYLTQGFLPLQWKSWR